MLEFFGAENGRMSSHQAFQKQDLESILLSPASMKPQSIQVLPPPGFCRVRMVTDLFEVIEIHMDTMDSPWRLRDQIKLISRRKQGT